MFLPILVGQHQAVFLQLVEGLAHLASEVGIGTCIDEVLGQLQFILAQGAEDGQRTTEHLGFRHNHQDFRQRHGGGEGGVGESDHK